jgi:NAD+ synthase
MRIRVLQLNPIVGDIDGNAIKLLQACQQAVTDNIDIVVTPECYLSGYPPEDLIFRKAFQDALTEKVEFLAHELKSCNLALILGTPRFDNGMIYNSALWLHKSAIQIICDKKHLPDYGVFDDSRLFCKGTHSVIIPYYDTNIGVLICEDMWHFEPACFLKNQKADMLISLNASPFEQGKFTKRLDVAQSRCFDTHLPLITCFMVGGQDEIIFDGFSFALDNTGNKIAQAKGFCSDFYDVTYDKQNLSGYITAHDMSDNALIYQAVTLGLRDYVIKNNFKGVVLGLSGGVDSVLSAVIAVDALGQDKVHCLLLPSQYTSQESFDDAYAVIANLGISYDIITIKEPVDSVSLALEAVFHGYPSDTTEENIQSRMRGLILMAYSNKIGHMVLTTGNKSEMAVGYATLYGDMCGGYNALKDIYKTKIYELCHYRNNFKPEIGLGKTGHLIPDNVITKAPTAELRDNQKDSNSLPDYPILDKILEMMIEQEMSVDTIIHNGFDAETVKKIRRLIDNAEYKRRQSAIGAKITNKNFGRDRRYPITQKFKT